MKGRALDLRSEQLFTAGTRARIPGGTETLEMRNFSNSAPIKSGWEGGVEDEGSLGVEDEGSPALGFPGHGEGRPSTNLPPHPKAAGSQQTPAKKSHFGADTWLWMQFLNINIFQDCLTAGKNEFHLFLLCNNETQFRQDSWERGAIH